MAKGIETIKSVLIHTLHLFITIEVYGMLNNTFSKPKKSACGNIWRNLKVEGYQVKGIFFSSTSIRSETENIRAQSNVNCLERDVLMSSKGHKTI